VKIENECNEEKEKNEFLNFKFEEILEE